MRTFIAAIYILLFVIYASAGIIIDKIVKVTPHFVYRNLQSLARTLIKISGSKIEIQGLENYDNNQNYLIVANHSSYFDPMLIAIHFERTTMAIAKAELSKFYPIKYWLTRQGCEFIERDNMRQSIKVITNATKKLESGLNCMIFPEGTRAVEIQEFKAGSFKIAQKAQKPILPITVINAAGMFEQSKRLKKVNVKLIIHPPIEYKDYEQLKLPEIALKTQQTVESKWTRDL